MSVYAVNDEGVTALNNTANSLVEESGKLAKECDVAISVAEEKRETLGPHVGSLIEALEAIKDEIDNDSEAIKEVASKIKDVADEYQEIIDEDNFAGVAGN
ncbi:MAG: hypothetical protein IJZ51_09300 [Ruminiclostridium sp.]|nr:hypothetical protein [Ruminiclostridium sp.]